MSSLFGKYVSEIRLQDISEDERTKLRNAFNAAKPRVDELAEHRRVANFYIGKTGQDFDATDVLNENRSLADGNRFAGHRSRFGNGRPIYRSEDTELIGNLEKLLIKYAQEHYPQRCTNIQVGGGPNDSDKVYITYNVA